MTDPIAVAKDFVAGTVAGIASIVVTQPLDTIRYRALYKGMVPPMVGVGLINASLFGSNALSRQLLPDDSLTSVFLAGCMAGVIQWGIACPVELVKIRLQLQREGLVNTMKTPYKGPWDCTKRIVRAYGVAGLLRGGNITFLRDVPGYGAYFVGFEASKRYLTKLTNSKEGEEPIWVLLTAGATAGVTGWLAPYPFDVLKTRVQGQPYLYREGRPGKPAFQGAWSLFKQGLREEGPRFLYKGIVATLVRAIPTNAIIFAVHDLVMRALNGKEHK